jgi:hypothetical protein
MCCSRRLNRAGRQTNVNQRQTNVNQRQTNDNVNQRQTNVNQRWRRRFRMQKKSHRNLMMQPAELSADNAVENPGIATLARTEGLGAALKLAKKTPACRVTFSRRRPYALIPG